MFAGTNHGAMVLHPSRSRRDFYWIIAAVAIFLCYASNFLYFFVDDEGIPLVYAQNLLRGRGLIYTTLEGRVESYTDFLHVLLDALFLGAVRHGTEIEQWREVYTAYAVTCEECA